MGPHVKEISKGILLGCPGIIGLHRKGFFMLYPYPIESASGLFGALYMRRLDQGSSEVL